MKNVLSSFTATALIQLANIGSGILLARILQPHGRGELALIMLWPTLIAALGILGVHEAISYHAARRRHYAGTILRDSLLLGIGLSLLLVPIGAVVVHFVLADQSDEIRSIAFLYLAGIPLNFLALFIISLFQGMQQFTEWNSLRSFVHVAYFLLIPIFYFAGWGDVRGFATASLLSVLIIVIAGLVLCARIGWFKAPPSDSFAAAAVPPPSVMRDLVSFGAKAHFSSAVAVIAERLDQLIISLTLSAGELGLFVVATTVARLPALLANTLGTLVFPKMAGAADEAERMFIFARYTRTTTLIVVPAAVATATTMPWILPWFFGPAFASVTSVAWVLVVGAVPMSLKAILGFGLKACNRSVVVGQTELVTFVLSASALAVLIPLYGLMGAAVASVIAQGGACIFILTRARAVTGLSLAALLLPGRGDFAAIGDMLSILKMGKARRAGGTL